MLISTINSTSLDLTSSGIIIAVCLVFTAFFSGAETGYMSVSRVRLRRLGLDASPGGRRLLRQMRRIEDPILTCLIGTNLSNVILSAVATMILTDLFGQKGELLAVILAGMLIIIFGEILPKVLYREYAEQMALASVPAISISMLVLAPLRWTLKGYTNLLRKALPGNKDTDSGELDRRGLAALLLSSSVPPAEDRRFSQALKKYLELASQRLAGVMRPFDEVETITQETTVGECLEIARDSGYSRLPIFDSDGCRRQGYVLVRDLLFLPLEQHSDPVPRQLWRRLLLVDQRMSPYDLFEEMRGRNKQLAIVVDPAGSPCGIITLEDLIEAVFGSLKDEFDIVENKSDQPMEASASGKEN